jgi:hypothetical protein
MLSLSSFIPVPAISPSPTIVEQAAEDRKRARRHSGQCGVSEIRWHPFFVVPAGLGYTLFCRYDEIIGAVEIGALDAKNRIGAL